VGGGVSPAWSRVKDPKEGAPPMLAQRRRPNRHRAALYPRVSSKPQAKGSRLVGTAEAEAVETSLDTQLAAMERYANDRLPHPTQDLAVYPERPAGAELWERPQLTLLREAMRAGEIDALIAYSVERLSREPVHLGVILSEAAHYGVDVHFITEPLDDSPEGQLITYVRGFAGRVERGRFRERSLRGRPHKRARGGKLLPAGRPLYGYRWRDEDTAALDPDPLTAPIVRRIYREAREGRSLRLIAQGLERDGIPTPTRKP